MGKKFRLICDIPEENVQAIFQKNPTIKQAFDKFWERQSMDEWIEKVAIPTIKTLPEGLIWKLEALHSSIKMVAMIASMEFAMQRIATEPATSSFLDCIEKVLKEEPEMVKEKCKDTFDEAIRKVLTKYFL